MTPRQPRNIIPGYPYHVIARGHNRENIFIKDKDRYVYLKLLREHKTKTGSKIYAYCLMDNHVHLIVEPSASEGLSKMMHLVSQCYTQYFNTYYSRRGTLWQGRFRSNLIHADNYLLICNRYIELNPVRARMVEHPQDFKWSSYKCKVTDETNELVEMDVLYEELGVNKKSRQKVYKEWVQSGIRLSELEFIRDKINKGMTIGSEEFIKETNN